MQTLHPAYVAGFIDGDGCISVHRSAGRHYGVQVIVVQAGYDVVEQLCRQYNGTLAHVRRGNRVYWRWVVASHLALRVLQDALPYLIEKHDQAELGIALIKHIAVKSFLRYQKGKMGTQRTLTEEELAFREEALARMKALNKRHDTRAAAETKPGGSRHSGDAIVRTA